MTLQEQIEAIKETAAVTGGKVDTEYSGRSMYGKTCYAVSGSDDDVIVEEAASRGLRGARRDQLGRGYIVYWPSISQPNQSDE